MAGTGPATISLPSQHAAGAFADLGDDFRRNRIDLRLRQRLVARLQGDGDGDGFLRRIDAGAFIDVEHRDAGDQFAIHPLGGAYDVAGLHAAVHDEGEIALHRLERR